jgi:PKD repeat protein
MLLVVINVTNLEKSIVLRMFQLTENVISFHPIGFNITLGTENDGDYSLTFASDNSYHILKSTYNKNINKYLLTCWYDFPFFENSTSTLYVEELSATIEGYSSASVVNVFLTITTNTSSYSYNLCEFTTNELSYNSVWYNRYQWVGHTYHEKITASVIIIYVGSSDCNVYVDFVEVHVKYSETVPPIPSYIPPVADFTYEPANPKVNETVTFNATSSYAVNGSIIAYKWDFGDGNITGWINNPITTHSYSTEGSYSVTLTVADSFNHVGKTIKLIVVGAPKPIPYTPSLVTFINEHPLTIALCIAIIAVALFVKK